ncbi:CBU_0592 family membrane protein [Sphingomonas sinipercae]|uniref:CBU_0592 family membrane protein n=1 Tax=Sphingomonas sinipercae TaxID=2714944 RepID=UPI001FE71A46|nr:hypothetical protein [Sphingomonas sinipercae]
MEVAGWGGAALILGGYTLLSTRRLTGESPLFHWMNLFGALGFVVNGWWHGAIPAAAMNVVWAGIAIYALIRVTGKARAGATPG